MKLSSGRDIDANRGLISINEEGEIGEGYDCMVPGLEREWWMDDEEWAEKQPFSNAEKMEMAVVMMTRWRDFYLKAASDA